MIVDSHFHLATDMISSRQLLFAMDRHGIEKTALIARLCDPIDEPAQGTLRLMRFALQKRLTRRLVKPFLSRFTDEGEVKLPQGPVATLADPDNESVFRVVEEHPTRFLAWAFVNPCGVGAPLEELRRWEGHPGFVGAKAHPFWHRYPPMALASVAARLEKLGKPLLIHLGFDRYGEILPLVNAFPSLKLVIAHAGIPYYQTLWRKLKGRPNIFFDLSAHAFVSKNIMQDVVKAAGPERCLFGTDGPYGPRLENGLFDHGPMIAMVKSAFSDSGIQKRLFFQNFAELTSQ